MLNTTCLCGNVQITLEKTPESLLSCNCSACHRYGAIWAYTPIAEATIVTQMPTLSFSRGDKNIAFQHCPTCGCLTHYTGTQDTENMAVNARMAPKERIENIKTRYFDGADTWTFLDE